MELSPTPLTISENQEIVQALQNDTGEFRFHPCSSVPLLSFKPTEDDAEIEHFFQKGITQAILTPLQELHMLAVPHPNDPEWTRQLAALLAMGCQEIFYPRFKSERIPSDFSFFGFRHGLKVDGVSPDHVFTLGQRPNEGDLTIPLLLLEEVIGLDNLYEETSRFSKYAKKIFAQQISFGEKVLRFENVYLLAMSQNTRQVKLIHYKRPGKDQTLAGCVQSTAEFILFENGTYKMNLDYFHDLLRVLFNCTFLQLKSLDLIK